MLQTNTSVLVKPRLDKDHHIHSPLSRNSQSSLNLCSRYHLSASANRSRQICSHECSNSWYEHVLNSPPGPVQLNARFWCHNPQWWYRPPRPSNPQLHQLQLQLHSLGPQYKSSESQLLSHIRGTPPDHGWQLSPLYKPVWPKAWRQLPSHHRYLRPLQSLHQLLKAYPRQLQWLKHLQVHVGTRHHCVPN